MLYLVQTLIPNLFNVEPVSKIFDRLYQGTLYGADLLRYDNPHGITLVVNCTKDKLPDIPRVKQVVLGLDDGAEIKGTVIDLAMVDMMLAINTGGSVLVVCHAGISRSTTIIISYLYCCGMSWDEALDWVRGKRPIVVPHPALVRSAKKLLKIYPYDTYDVKDTV